LTKNNAAMNEREKNTKGIKNKGRERDRGIKTRESKRHYRV
jgi:hypothetical protein